MASKFAVIFQRPENTTRKSPFYAWRHVPEIWGYPSICFHKNTSSFWQKKPNENAKNPTKKIEILKIVIFFNMVTKK